MSLHFNLNLSIELSYDTPNEIIDLFKKKVNGQKWNKEDKKIIPFDNEIEYLFELGKSLREQCLQTFHFQKQDYLKFAEFRNLENEFYCFHLSRTIGDDGFYQGGYELIVWLAKHSRTNGYMGEYHEPESNELNLLFVQNGVVTVQKTRGESIYQMSSADFDFEPPDTTKMKRIIDLNTAIDNQNWNFAEMKIDELISQDPNSENYKNIKQYLIEKKNTTDNK